MHRLYTILRAEIVSQHTPKVGIAVANFHMQASPFGTYNATASHTFPAQIGPKEDVGGIVASHHTCLALMVERIEVFLGRQTMVNPRDGLVADMTETLRTQHVVQFAKQRHCLGYRQPLTHQQAAIRQATMGTKRVTIGMCRKYSQQPLVTIEQQRVVVKAVGMIVHVATIEEKCAILRLRHELIPLSSLV